MTLLLLIAALDAGTSTIESGVNAQLTRTVYVTPFENIMNYQRFIPVLSYNLITKTIQTESGMNTAFTANDILVQDDWVVLNSAD